MIARALAISTTIAVSLLLVGVTAWAPAAATETASRGLGYRCRLVATKLGDEITLTPASSHSGARDDWRVRLFHESERVYSGVRRTNHDGDLKVVRVEPNLPKRDHFAARARHLETGTLCTVESRI